MIAHSLLYTRKPTSKMAGRSGKGDGKFYILMENCVGEERKKSYISRSQSFEPCNAISGEIFCKEKNKDETTTEFRFLSVENQDRSITCVEDKLRPIKKKSYEVLIAIPSKNERILLLKNNTMFHDIMGIEKGDMVKVEISNPDGNKTVSGKVRHIGSIPGKTGLHFGICFEVICFI